MWDIEAYVASIEDRRSTVWQPPFGRSTQFMVGVTAGYLLLVLWLGPRLMEKRRPFSLKRVLVAYNFVQMVANAYYVYRLADMFIDEESRLWCQPMMYHRTDERGISAFRLAHYFYALKILDLLDTVFFVLRKKWNQISFLHVSHHASMIVYLWFAIRLYPGGTLIWASTANAFVHTIMYGYYLLAAIHLPGLSMIKPFITTLQLTQFVLNGILVIGGTAFGTCERPIIFQLSVVFANVFYFFLFMKFYRKTYRHEGHQGFVRKVM